MGPTAAAEAALDFGPTRLLLDGMKQDVVEAAQTAITAAFSDYVDHDGNVILTGAINLITAARR